MSKLIYLIVSSTFIILTSIVVNALNLDDQENPAGDVPSEVDNSVGSLFGVLETFFDLIAFRIDAVPFMFNIVFVVIAIGTLYVVIDIVKDIIPFT